MSRCAERKGIASQAANSSAGVTDFASKVEVLVASIPSPSSWRRRSANASLRVKLSAPNRTCSTISVQFERPAEPDDDRDHRADHQPRPDQTMQKESRARAAAATQHTPDRRPGDRKQAEQITP